MTTTNKHGQGTRYLRFSLGDEEYALELLKVREVIALPEVTPIPQTPAYFLGIINLRGQVITVLDLRAKLGIKPLKQSEEAVIICDLGTISLGVLVDSINSVVEPSSEEISEKPDIKNQRSMEYITGVYKHAQGLVLLLDITKLFSVEEQATASRAQVGRAA